MDINKLNLLDELEKIQLPNNEYALAGSAPLVVRGIKDKNKDLDLVVTKKLWNVLKLKNPVKTTVFNGKSGSFIAIGNVDIISEVIGFSEEECEQMIREADIINGYRFISLANVIKWKKILNREKDLIDIELIIKYQLKEGELK